MKMEIIYKKTSELIPYINNPRKNDKAVDAVASSIKNFGFKVPIIIDSQGEIIAGHTRLKAAKKLNIKEVPCLIADDLTPAQIKAFRIADNKVSEFAEWDMDLLKIEIQDLEEFTGFELEELNMMFEEEKEIIEDEVPEIQKEVITKLGDLYEIGEHRLLCGDSTDGDQLAKLMNGQKADMVFTDPPYRYKKMGNNGAFHERHNKLKEDIKEMVDFDPTDFLQTLPFVFNKGINAYIFCNTDLVPDYCIWAKKNKFNFNILTWHKKSFIPASNNHHFPDTEYLIYISKTAIFNSGLNVNYGKYFILDNEKSKDHPTIKPIELILNEIKISSNKNNLVFDFFLGSGSTMVACQQLNRKCYGMELDPKYCDVIIRRMINLDPHITIKRNNIDCKQEFTK
jgi:site-specific DNA-methyltransferase (adenine-specific)